MTQTKRDTLVLQVEGWTGTDNPPHKYYSVKELLKLDAGCVRTILEESKINQWLKCEKKMGIMFNIEAYKREIPECK